MTATTVKGQCRREFGGYLAKCHSFWFSIFEKVIITSEKLVSSILQDNSPYSHNAHTLIAVTEKQLSYVSSHNILISFCLSL